MATATEKVPFTTNDLISIVSQHPGSTAREIVIELTHDNYTIKTAQRVAARLLAHTQSKVARISRRKVSGNYRYYPVTPVEPAPKVTKETDVPNTELGRKIVTYLTHNSGSTAVSIATALDELPRIVAGELVRLQRSNEVLSHVTPTGFYTYSVAQATPATSPDETAQLLAAEREAELEAEELDDVLSDMNADENAESFTSTAPETLKFVPQDYIEIDYAVKSYIFDTGAESAPFKAFLKWYQEGHDAGQVSRD